MLAIIGATGLYDHAGLQIESQSSAVCSARHRHRLRHRGKAAWASGLPTSHPHQRLSASRGTEAGTLGFTEVIGPLMT